MTFNIGVIIGPVLGGLLSDPAGSYPDTFGKIAFLVKYPYVAPNLVSAGFLFIALVMCWMFLEEVCSHPTRYLAPLITHIDMIDTRCSSR